MLTACCYSACSCWDCNQTCCHVSCFLGLRTEPKPSSNKVKAVGSVTHPDPREGKWMFWMSYVGKYGMWEYHALRIRFVFARPQQNIRIWRLLMGLAPQEAVQIGGNRWHLRVILWVWERGADQTGAININKYFDSHLTWHILTVFSTASWCAQLKYVKSLQRKTFLPKWSERIWNAWHWGLRQGKIYRLRVTKVDQRCPSLVADSEAVVRTWLTVT